MFRGDSKISIWRLYTFEQSHHSWPSKVTTTAEPYFKGQI